MKLNKKLENYLENEIEKNKWKWKKEINHKQKKRYRFECCVEKLRVDDKKEEKLEGTWKLVYESVLNWYTFKQRLIEVSLILNNSNSQLDFSRFLP